MQTGDTRRQRHKRRLRRASSPMAESAQQLAAALDRLTSAITSGSGLPRRLLQTQLQHLQIAFTALPVPCPAFRADGEQAVLRAAMAALQALADDRRARDRKWVLLVAAASEAWMRLWRSCHASTQKERVAWLLLHSKWRGWCHVLQASRPVGASACSLPC